VYAFGWAVLAVKKIHFVVQNFHAAFPIGNDGATWYIQHVLAALQSDKKCDFRHVSRRTSCEIDRRFQTALECTAAPVCEWQNFRDLSGVLSFLLKKK